MPLAPHAGRLQSTGSPPCATSIALARLNGRDAQGLRPLLGRTPVIESAHPSPLSASRGFFGSRPFSRANAMLVAQGGEPVDWSLPA